MKKEEFDRHIDNIIIDGLIREAEQENADFADAIRRMPFDEFALMVGASHPVKGSCKCDESIELRPKANTRSCSTITRNRISLLHIDRDLSCSEVDEFDEDDFSGAMDDDEPLVTDKLGWQPPHEPFDASTPRRSRFKPFLPWLAATIAAAAVVLAIIIPARNAMNGRLCDSALYMSQAYITASKGGFDISAASVGQIRAELPALEERYNALATSSEPVVTADLQDAGWTLAVAYLKLHDKAKAVGVLTSLSARCAGSPFGDHCQALLRQLK